MSRVFKYVSISVSSSRVSTSVSEECRRNTNQKLDEICVKKNFKGNNVVEL